MACSDAELMLIPPEDDGLRRGKDDGDHPGCRHHQSEREVLQVQEHVLSQSERSSNLKEVQVQVNLRTCTGLFNPPWNVMLSKDVNGVWDGNDDKKVEDYHLALKR